MITPRSVLIALLASTLFGCAPPTARPNQKQGAVSPSGKYALRLPIEAQTTNPQYKGTRVWKVTITDSSGKVLYKDEERG